MVTPNFDHYFEMGENARKRGEPREVPKEISDMHHFGSAISVSFLKGWDFRDAVLSNQKSESEKPSSYP